MRFFRTAAAAAATAAATASLALPAAAQPPVEALPPAEVNEVVVFTFEFTKVAVYPDPQGCQRQPVGAHVLVNRTPNNLTIYLDPFCTIPIKPFSLVRPDFGTHVSPAGSFQVEG